MELERLSIKDGWEIVKDSYTSYGASQIVLRFTNGRGASIISGNGTYGVELAVICFNGHGGWVLDYSTPVTDDVMGWLSESELAAALEQIDSLPPVQ